MRQFGTKVVVALALAITCFLPLSTLSASAHTLQGASIQQRTAEFSPGVHRGVDRPLGTGCSSSGGYCYVDPGLQDFCGTGWNGALDPNYLEWYWYTITTGSRFCDQATWGAPSFARTRSCYVSVFIPTFFGTATVAYGIFNSSHQRIGLPVINQNNVNGWVFLSGHWSGISYVQISNNNGQDGEYLAAGQVEFLC